MNTIDTIYLTGDLITEKLCGCKEALPIIIQQTKEPCCDNVKAIVPIICLTIAVVTLLVVAGEVVWHLVKLYKEKEEKERDRKYKERENLVKLKQDYQARVLEEFISFKKICEHIEDEKRKLEKMRKEQEKNRKDKHIPDDPLCVSKLLEQIGNLLAGEGEKASICDQISKYIQEEKKKIEDEKEKKEDNSLEAILNRIEKNLSEASNERYKEKLNDYFGKLNDRIGELDKELGIKNS